MNRKRFRELLISILALLVVVGASVHTKAQQTAAADDELLIKNYRSQIKVLIENAPSPGSASEADYRSALAGLRLKLRDLLIEKRGALKSKIRNLEPSVSSPEIAQYVSALDRERRDVDAEVANLDQQLGSRDILVPPVLTVASPPPSPLPSPSPTEMQKAFELTVARLALSDPKADAAPPEVAETELPEFPCTEDGSPNSFTASKFDTAICGLAALVSEQRDDQIIHLATAKGELFPILIAKLLKTKGSESYVAFVTEAQEARVDQQIGSGPTIPSSTSLVAKGGVPYAFGFAVENGAATQSLNDTTITYRVNPTGVVKLFAKKGFITGFQQNESDPFLKFLGKTSLGFTFDTSRGNQPGVFTGDKQQLAAFSARVEFVNDRDPRLKKYEKAWEEFVATAQVKLSEEIWKTSLAINDWGTATTDESFRDPALQAWLVKTNQEFAAVDKNLSAAGKLNQFAEILRRRADLLPVDAVSDETVTSITSFAKALLAYSREKDALINRIAKSKIFTLDYTNKREVNASDTSTFNFIAATGIGARIDLTANGSFTFFHTRPAALSLTTPRSGRFRDFQFAGQVTVPFKVGESQFDVWFSGRYERLLEDAETFAGTILPNTKGDIAFGQFGLNIPIPGLGVKFPVSFTFANRTELVKEKEVRGNFGFTFNWDTLFSKLKPF